MFRFAVGELDELNVDSMDEDTDDPYDLMFWYKGAEQVAEWENPKG